MSKSNNSQFILILKKIKSDSFKFIFFVSVTKIGQKSNDCHIYQMIDYDLLKNIITFIIYELVFEKGPKIKTFQNKEQFV